MFTNADHQSVWSPTIELREAAAAMRRAIDVKGSGYVYDFAGMVGCHYADERGGKPSCAVGWIIYDLAGDQQIWSEITAGYNAEAWPTLVGDGLINTDPVTLEALSFTQQAQDHGYTWIESASVLFAMAEGREHSVVAWLVTDDRCRSYVTPRFSVAERWVAATNRDLQELEAEAVIAMMMQDSVQILDPRTTPFDAAEPKHLAELTA
jgi:hypothetical protein